MFFVVKYVGHFGFIKPWTAVRDKETFSQQFLTPSIIEGMEKKLFPDLLGTKGIQKIKRHRLNYLGIDIQQERTWAKGGFKASREKGKWKSNLAIIDRGILLEPHLYLAFELESEALIAMEQHLCLCRNEDVLLPIEILKLSESEFDTLSGFELLFDGDSSSQFKVGHNRYANAAEMFGQLMIYGNPIRAKIE